MSRFKPESGKRRRDSKESRLAGLLGSCFAVTAEDTAAATSSGRSYLAKTDFISRGSSNLDLDQRDTAKDFLVALEEDAVDGGVDVKADPSSGTGVLSFFFPSRGLDVVSEPLSCW